MAEIVPAIIAKSFEELEKKIRLVEPYVNWVQLDVMDGKFAPEKSWPYICHPELISGSRGNVQEMPKQANPERGRRVRHDRIKLLKELNAKLNLEAHLMIEEPEKEIDKWLESGVKRILVHYEALANEKGKSKNEQVPRRRDEKLKLKIKNLIKKCDVRNVELGIVLNLETPIDVLEKLHVTGFMPHVIQLMSIAQIGYHGHPFDEKVIPKIRALKERRFGVKIAVDGGINKETAKLVLGAGADILVVGSAIFENENIEETIKELKNIN
jgi:ribulose-phosphate 3-epimerase